MISSLLDEVKRIIKRKHYKLTRKYQPPLRVSPDETRLKVNLGCGHERLEGFLNVDCQATPATDRLEDLTLPNFEPNSIALAFSNAFFEHLFRDSRGPHVRRICESLVPDGACCYIGVPYFRNIAKFYLERGLGTNGRKFDLANVYSYTHGHPELAGDPVKEPVAWMSQLHKSLFDEDELGAMLEEAGFGSYVIFCYAYPGDRNEIPVCVGFYASKNFRPEEELREKARAFLQQFADRRIRMNTLQWL